MSTLETEFFQKDVRPKLVKWAAAYDRIEATAGGVADVSYALSNVQGWIELKVAKGNSVYFRKYQIPWLLTRVGQAYHVFLLILDAYGFVNLIHARELISAPRRKVGRYTVVNMTDMIPMASGRPRDKDFWETVKKAMTDKSAS